MELRHQHLTRYISPLREGGSLPALAEADDGFKYAVKFRGAGHGVKALIAELIGGEIARKLGMKVPEIVFLDVDSRFGITEPDVEIQDLLKASRGVNLGFHYLSGSMTLDPYINPVDSRLAAEIVWLDSYLINIDRTAANTSLPLSSLPRKKFQNHIAMNRNYNFIKALVGTTNVIISSELRYSELHALVEKASVLENGILTIKVKECTIGSGEIAALAKLGGKYVAFDLTEC